MANEVLNLYTLPDAVPAVPVAGWSNTNGGGLARINNGVGFFATNDLWAGWTLNSPLGVDGNGDYLVEYTIKATAGGLDSYSSGVSMLNSAGNGYLLVKSPYAAILRRVTGGINGSFVTLVNQGTSLVLPSDTYHLKYNPTTGLLRVFKNGLRDPEDKVTSFTDMTYSAATLFGGFMGNGYNNFTGIRSTTIYNVAAAPTLTIATALTPSASRTDTCTEFANGVATLTFSGVSVPVTIASGSFTWTVPMLADGVTWPRLPATGQTITLTQGGTTANTTANINLPTGHQTLRVGDVIGGAVANFAGVVTDNDRMLGYHFLAAANPLSTDDTAYFVTSDNYWVYRNGDVGADTASLPRTDTLYVQDTTTGVVSSHSVTLSPAGVVVEDNTPYSFTFTAVTNANVNTSYISNEVTISGLGTGVAATLTVANGTYSKNGGAFTSSAGVISNGDTLRVRRTSSASYNTAVTASVTVGTYTTSYSITTKIDNDPDNIKFVTLSALSNIETIEGVVGSVPISITGGQYSKNSGAFTATAGTVVNTDTIQLSAVNGSTVRVTIGGKTFSWSSKGGGGGFGGSIGIGI